MITLPESHISFLQAISELAEINPFSLERAKLESRILNIPIAEEGVHLNNWLEHQHDVCNISQQLQDCLIDIQSEFKHHPYETCEMSGSLYRTGVWFYVYHKYAAALDRHLEQCAETPDHEPHVDRDLYPSFRNELLNFLQFSPNPSGNEELLTMNEEEIVELFAFCYQLRRGYLGIIRHIIGRSLCTSKLREHVWEAIFTRRLLWSFKYVKERMANFSTLILGGSGTGKELVARAIGTSQYIPYLPHENRFAINYLRAYQAINLSALTPTLIESELFGHAKGAFTGANTARRGLLEISSPYGALFLDEVGELSQEIQVKLLRVLQTREIQPLGGGKRVFFQGRILSATNRDISTLVREGVMREDFLYRLGSVVIRVPTLAQRLQESPQELDDLLHFILQQVLGTTDAAVYHELQTRIRRLIDSHYGWPGNVRELEQCIRSMIVTSEYIPLTVPTDSSTGMQSLFQRMNRVQATLGEVVSEYCSYAFQQTPNYQELSQRLKVDWRTIKKHVQGSNGDE